LEYPLTDIRAKKFAQILVDYSTQVKPGDRVAITATTAAEPAVQAIFELVLARGAYPHPLLELPLQREALLTYGSEEQLNYVPLFHKLAFEEFDVLIKLRSDTNTRELSNVDSARFAHYQKMQAVLIDTQMQRGADRSLRWMSTLYPTISYAMEAEMGWAEYQDFFYRACHADENTPDPVAYWQNIKNEQDRVVKWIEGHDQVTVRGPNVDITLSIKERKFINACGTHNMPDGEVYTGPVEDSANGWVRYSYPAVYQGHIVEGVELNFENGKVTKATAEKNEAFLNEMLSLDPGAKYLGEFAIGLNFDIDRFTRSILFDEKIGGSFHMALGAGYPETGSVNKSQIHWDMICDLRQDSEIKVDGELMYRNGEFVI
jgi:aminopeptidase